MMKSVTVLGFCCLLACGGPLTELAPPALVGEYACEHKYEYAQHIKDVLLTKEDPMSVLKADFEALKASTGSPAKALAEATCAVMQARAELQQLQDTKDQVEGAIRSIREAAELADAAVKDLGKI